MKHPLRSVIALLGLCLFLTACGTKGDLYLPANGDQASPTAGEK